MPLRGIINYVPLDDHVATGGQPDEEQLAHLARAGFEQVVNLGLLDPRYSLPDEAGLVRRLGMEYVHIPVDFRLPRLDDLRAFVRVMDQAARRKVFVHCALNYRVSAFIWLYGQLRWKWTRWRADEFLHGIWTPNSTWSAFLDMSTRLLEPGLDPKMGVRERVQLFYDGIWNRQDKKLVPALLAEEVTFRGSLGKATRGHSAFTDYLDAIHAALGQLRCEVEETICEGDKVFARLRFAGLHRGRLVGFPPTGKQVSWAVAASFAFRDGRIVDLWELGDAHALLRQLSAIALRKEKS